MSDRTDFSPDAQRYLDGERPDGLAPAERASADRLSAALAAYRAGTEAPGPALDEAVMRRVRLQATRPSATLWQWMFVPRTVRVRPIVLALAASLAVLVWWTAGNSRRPLAPVSLAAPETLLVRFELAAPGAREVSLSGSFNGWMAPGIALRKSAVPGLWTVTVPLPLGEHQYLFIVDGTRWISDPSAHAQVDDGFGRTNSVIVVGPRGVARS